MAESDRQAAKELLAGLRKFSEAGERLVNDEVGLGKTIGTRSPATPDSLAIAAGRAHLLILTELVLQMGTTLAEHLIESAKAAEHSSDADDEAPGD